MIFTQETLKFDLLKKAQELFRAVFKEKFDNVIIQKQNKREMFICIISFCWDLYQQTAEQLLLRHLICMFSFNRNIRKNSNFLRSKRLWSYHGKIILHLNHQHNQSQS